MRFKKVDHSLQFTPSASPAIQLSHCQLFLPINVAISPLPSALPALFCIFPSLPPRTLQPSSALAACNWSPLVGMHFSAGVTVLVLWCWRGGGVRSVAYNINNIDNRNGDGVRWTLSGIRAGIDYLGQDHRLPMVASLDHCSALQTQLLLSGRLLRR